jgi:UDP-3-O-[3-hydroxymyristoyl] N-acetylglucosamine deacetylase
MNEDYLWLGVLNQRTLKTAIPCTGIGIHTGAVCHVELCPAPRNTGIEFHIMKSQQCVAVIPATIAYVNPSNNMRTVLQHAGHTVATVEHLLAALAAYHIDNLYIKVHGSEIPIHSGCASDWCFLIQCAGIEEQSAAKRRIFVQKTVSVWGEEGSWASLTPDHSSVYRYDIDYTHPLIGQSTFELELTTKNFLSQVAQARTFGFYRDLDMIRLHGLAQGVSLLNTVVFDEARIMGSALRWPDEPARHKVCDAVGDLSLAGHEIVGKFHGHKSGHALNQLLVGKLLAHSNNWRYSNGY